jgi:hypothetical protein
MINKSDKKDNIYKSLGLDPPKKQKIKAKKRKVIKKSLKDFLAENFSIMEM